MSSSPAMNLCFNSNCKQPLKVFGAVVPRRGWRRRSGDYADLCGRCASVYEEGKFCETFHMNASGWRCCETCGKQIHCGCIVSFHMFVLLDAGGIECISCARKSFILTPNPAWPPPPSFLPSHSERTKDLSSRNWCNLAGSGPVPWRQAPSFFGSSCAQPNLQQSRANMEVDVTGGFQKLTFSNGLSVASFDKKKLEVPEGLINGTLKLGSSEKHASGNSFSEHANLRVNMPQQPPFLKKESPHVNLPLCSLTRNETKDPTMLSSTRIPQPIPPNVNGKNCLRQCGTGPSGDTRLPHQSFSRYWPKTSNHELQQVPGTSKTVTTPLFEKVLSVSDAGNLGRLILPKKCAETYFPQIAKPEGLSLKVQDFKGKEWTFQFRFWPNNNSRMYVLEGVYPCMQSMNLQAGDIVTFNRTVPEGKLVMGFRKSTAPSNQEAGIGNTSNASSKDGDDCANKSKNGEGVSNYLGLVRKANFVDQASPHEEDKKVEFTGKEFVGAKSTMSNKRKSNVLGSKSKNSRTDIDDLMIRLEMTLEQAQGLFCPPLNRMSHVVAIEEFEIEEYEDAPVIGRPTIIATDNTGDNVQWAQCEDCLKWRKVPADASLPSRWTCSANSWDLERSSCATTQEMTTEQLEELLPRSNQAASQNINAVKQEPDSFVDLDKGDENLSSQSSLNHPRHRPGCTCIVCIQPPKGESFKHIHICTCNICVSTKRRFQTLLSKREHKQSEKEAEIPVQKLADHQSSLNQDGDLNIVRASFKGQFDLNIQPERDEEQSPRSDSGELMKLIQESTEVSETGYTF